MWIRDNEAKENAVRMYGTNPHDSLVVSQDGKYLSYYNLQNGDGSIGGGYSFTDEDGNIPVDIEDEYDNTVYANIGGFGHEKDEEEDAKLHETIYQHGFDRAEAEVINAFELCKAWSDDLENGKLMRDAVDVIEQIVLCALEGVKQPHRETKTDEG